MRKFVQKLVRARVGPKLPVAAWWAWRTLGFARPAAFTGRVGVGARTANLEWMQTGELLQALSIFGPENAWNRWQPGHDIRTVLDVGANIGQTLAYWKLRFPGARIAAVEMMPDNLGRIRRQEELNGWKFGVVAVAATDTAAAVRVRLSHANSRNRLEDIVESSAVRDNLRTETISVPGLPLAAIMDRLDFATVDLMKVDIEGAEVNLLRDIRNWSPRVRHLLIEVHDNVDRMWAKAQLEAAGFSLRPLVSEGNQEWLCTRVTTGVAQPAGQGVQA